MKIIDKVIDCILAVLPFLRRKDGTQLKEFSDLIKSQYGFLVEQLEKALRDYFELSDRVKDLHTEIVALREQLAATLPERCLDHTCQRRKLTYSSTATASVSSIQRVTPKKKGTAQ